MADPVILTRGLTRRFGDRVAVADLDLELPPGVIFGLVGPNGAGKTTTLRLLAGLLEPSAGEIRILGRRATGARHLDHVRHAIGYMPDFFGVYEDMRAGEYLDFYARCYGLPRTKRRRLVGGLLELVGLSDRRDADVSSLSRGMQQRLCLAHALVHDPPILLLDEPASGLDPRARRELRALLTELRAMGKTVLLSSHVLSELAEICDQVGVMERGKLVAGGDLAEIERGLAAGERVEIELLTPAEPAREILRGLRGVTLEPLETPGRLSFRVEGGAEAHAALIVALVSAGVGICAYRPRRRDLERVFLQLTQGEGES